MGHKVVKKIPGQPAEVLELPELDYTYMKNLIDGGMLQVISVPMPGGVQDLWMDEEGKLKALPRNFVIPHYIGAMAGDFVVGPCFFAQATDEGKSTGLNADEVEQALEFFESVDR